MRVLCKKSIFYGWKSWSLCEGMWYDTDLKIHDSHISHGGIIHIFSEKSNDFYEITCDVFKENFIGMDQIREDKLKQILNDNRTDQENNHGGIRNGI